MSTVEFRLKPQGKVLTEYMNDRSRVSTIIGPLGSSKTYQTCQKIFKLMTEQKPNKQGKRLTRWYAVRNTYPDLMSTTVKDWMELFGDLGVLKKGGLEPPTHYIQFELEDGTTVKSELVFLALDRDDAVKKLRGAQVTAFWLNEVKELRKSITDMADMRHGRFPSAMEGGPSWHGMLADTNAPDQDHWLYKLAEIDKPEGWKFFIQPGGLIKDGMDSLGRVVWKENPEAENINNLPEGYYTRGKQGKSDDWINVNLANNYGFVIDGKPVYPEYNDNVHCHEVDPVKNLPIYRGWDFGRTPCCIFTQLTPHGTWIILDELTSTDMGIERFSEELITFANNYYPGYEFVDIGDPAGAAKSQTDEKTCFQILHGKGILIEPGAQDPTTRIESVKKPLNTLINGVPMLQIDPRCKEVRKGFMGGYQYRKMQVAGERFTEKPDKNEYSHPHDALQYVASRLFAGMIRSESDLEDYDNQAYFEDYDDERSEVSGY